MAVVSDDFTRANATTLGAGWTQVTNSHDIVSNAAVTGAGTDVDRFNSPVNTDDMYAKATMSVETAGNFAAQVFCRMSTTAFTGYAAGLVQGFAGAGAWVQLVRFVAGSETALVSAQLIENPAVGPYVIEVRAVGDQISAYVDGVLKLGPVTDTNIATGLRTGLRTHDDGFPTPSVAYLDIEAGDYTPPIRFEAVGAKSTAAATTTVSIAHPAGTAANQILLAGRCAWETPVTFSDETGWTARGSLSGGTGTAADNHQTAIRADSKEIAGADAGPTVFDQTVSAGAGVCGVMLSYEKTDSTATWDVATATGDDATHAANRSATGSSTISLAPGDWVVAFAAVDTDAALTITSPAITASGITFGSTTRRTSGAGSTSGDDGNIEVFDAEVVSGSGTVAPTLAFTTATSQCGPVDFVRLRAVPPPAAPVRHRRTPHLTYR